jgi:hypothetical protein
MQSKRYRSRQFALLPTLGWALWILLPLSVLGAFGAEQDGFSFRVGAAGATITNYRGPGGKVVIPEFLGGSPVTGIEQLTFYGMTNLTRVQIPYRVTYIGSGAFLHCTKLTSAVIPQGVTSIADHLFAGCASLTNVVIPEGVMSIGGAAFDSCAELIDVTIPDSVKFLDYAAFRGCAGLRMVKIGNSVTSIGNAAFGECASLPSISIPGSVTNLGITVFRGGSSMTAIEVDASNAVYSSAAGVLFNKDQSVLIACPVGKTGHYSIPDGVKSIGDRAFSGCLHLTSLAFPKGLASIGGYAFAECASLGTVSLPESLSAIGMYAFSGCMRLMAIEVEESSLRFRSAGGVLFNKDQSVLVAYPGGRAGGYVIPDLVTSVGDTAFQGCAGLSSITILGSVKSLGYSAFSGCGLLNLLTIGNGVTNIQSFAFYGCTNLSSVTIPDSVTSIGDDAFGGCSSLMKVTMGAGVKLIRADVFRDSSALTSVYFPGNPPSRGGLIFDSCPFVTVFYRPETTGWGPIFGSRPTAVWVPLPSFGDWAQAIGLMNQHPDSSAETDDPDSDGLTNQDEWLAGTDPSQISSRLEFEFLPRTEGLASTDQTAIPFGKRALYFRSVPGRYYGLERASSLAGPWKLEAVRVAKTGTTQTRVLSPESDPDTKSFYRAVVLP